MCLFLIWGPYKDTHQVSEYNPFEFSFFNTMDTEDSPSKTEDLCISFGDMLPVLTKRNILYAPFIYNPTLSSVSRRNTYKYQKQLQ